jgi:hypothetical protein
LENCVKKWTSYVIFPKKCHDCPKNKIPHIVYITKSTSSESWLPM